MTRTAKILLGGCGGLLIVGIVLIVAFVIALNYFEARMAESTKGIETEGVEFGKTRDQQACIVEGLRRSRTTKITDFGESVDIMTFVDSCLKNARPTPSFCDGVPPILQVEDSNEWKADQCRRARMDELNTGCRIVFKTKQDVCRPLF